VHGEEHSDYAVTLNNLANLYVDTGEYDKAETLYCRSWLDERETPVYPSWSTPPAHDAGRSTARSR
jgi:hypothetical protein